MPDLPTLAAAADCSAGSVERSDQLGLFELALESADAMTWVWDLATDLITWVGSAGGLVADDTKVLGAMEFLQMVHHDDRGIVIRSMQDVLTGQGDYQCDYRAEHVVTGELRWQVARGRAVLDAEGNVIRILGVAQDITDRRRMEEELRASEERFKTVLAGAPLAILAFGTDGVVTLAQGSALDAMGVDGDILVGAPVRYVLREYPEALTAIERTLEGEVVDTRLEIEGITFDMSYRPLRDAVGEVIGAVIVATDVTQEVRAGQQLERLALHDPLTDLANRVLFNNRLELHLARSARRHGHTAVLFLDLDKFKHINDTYGHHVGDDLLRGVAARLRESVRPEDTIARFGGDEFLILSEIGSSAEAEAIARRVLAAVTQPMQIGPLTLEAGVSIGVAIAGPIPEHRVTEVAASLIRQADGAMYSAKQEGRGRYVIVSDTSVEQPVNT